MLNIVFLNSMRLYLKIRNYATAITHDLMMEIQK